jgi:hypothetical protein
MCGRHFWAWSDFGQSYARLDNDERARYDYAAPAFDFRTIELRPSRPCPRLSRHRDPGRLTGGVLVDEAHGPLPNMRYRRHEVRGANYLVAIGGRGAPVLLLHGFPQTHYCWRHLIPQLSGRQTIVIPDLRG